MIIFPIVIVLSVVMYIYYKVAILKTKDRLTQAYFNAKSRICLGLFISFFGINQYVFYQTKISLFVGIIFIFLGILQLVRGFRETKHYRNEWKRLNPAD
ncbi:YtpI family protein [Ornithinibacillus bavariensis]|uniref:Membrane protein n=1 Tax=Ornithinibacillus bavariensis TaxID=545502 RepID=A0A920C6H9_9BACI|nr:YtpI family protein [Ornithinibacillus bavariensis]GIO27820.1 membrane protein [Ornithinibacillus bavariensis]